MHNLRRALRATQKAEPSEHVQHGGVLGQYFRNQLLEAGFTRQGSQMPHEDRPDPLGLVGVDHNKGDLGLARLDNDIASTAGDDGAPVFIDLRNERDVVFEIDVEKESQLLLGKAFLWREKAPPERVRTRSSDRREHPGPVIGAKGADFNRSTVAKMLDDRIVSGQRHEKWFPVQQQGALPVFDPS
jgi:hypothetical protein